LPRRLLLRVDLIEETGSSKPTTFPPDEGYVDLRENPLAIDRLPAARKHPPLRNFLASVNGPESIFTTGEIATRSEPAAESGASSEFSSQFRIVFAVLNFNWERAHYADLCAGVKELLERDASGAARITLEISPCDFTVANRSGYCLDIGLVAGGNSPQQAEMRWGLALARVQQALLFQTRALRHQME